MPAKQILYACNKFASCTYRLDLLVGLSNALWDAIFFQFNIQLYTKS